MLKLIQGIHQFQDNLFSSQRELFERLSKGQTPDALFITWSDSRINPNLITQTEPGELFILRNAIHGSVTLRVMPHVVAFGVLATLIEVLVLTVETHYGVRIALPVAPYEIAGALVGLLLVLRNNAGYDRWWEGRKLWGGIVNQSRNLTISALAYGCHSSRCWSRIRSFRSTRSESSYSTRSHSDT